MSTSMSATPFTHTATVPGSKTFHISLWIAQGLLAVAFLMAGSMKLFTPLDQLANMMPWVRGAMGSYAKLIGCVEILGAIGLIVPSVTRIAPQLSPLAALGLLLTMLGAVSTHLSRGEFPMLGAPVTLGALAAFVAWGRWVKAPIAPR
jgi:putative oxidoreductase